MNYLPPFALFGSRTAVDDNRLHAHVDDWGRLLTALVEDRVDTQQAAAQQILNEDLSRIIRSQQ